MEGLLHTTRSIMIAPMISDKRPIIEVSVNGITTPMLVDTGSALGIIDINKKEELGFSLRSKLSGNISGVGGESSSPVYHVKNCDVNILGVPLVQFVTTDISGIISSIKKETGIEISGIIGFTQIELAEMKIDVDNKVVKIGY